MLTANRVIPAAINAGLLTADDVVKRTVEVCAIGMSHPVFRLSIDGRPMLILKTFSARRGDTDGELACELAVATLADRIPALAALLPMRLPWTGPEQVIATAFRHGAVAGSFDGMSTGTSDSRLGWPELVRALVPKLALMHLATQELQEPKLALSARIPWGLRLIDGDASTDIWANSPLAHLLSEFFRDSVTVSAVRRARGAWRVRCLIHGDLKHDNILVYPDGVDIIVTVIDWEMARWGDPAWDLAALFVRPLLVHAHSANAWSEANIAAAAMLVVEYARVARLSPQALCQRLVFYSGIWLIMTALQYVSTLVGTASKGEVMPILAAARATLIDADQLTTRLIAKVEESMA